MEDDSQIMEDWRNEHGQPNFVYLQSLVKDGSIEALEKLKSIAEDLDISSTNISPEELVEKIRTEVAQNGDEASQPTT